MNSPGPGRGFVSRNTSGSQSGSGKSIYLEQGLSRVQHTDWTVDASTVELGDIIGYGSNNVRVYKALIDGFQEVAVKEIPKNHSMDQEAEANGILQEVEVMVKTGSRCPTVLTLYGVYDDEYSYKLVMEFCEQGSLMNYIKRVRERELMFAWHKRIAMARSIAEAMAYLHNCNVLHRDLKSPNVLLTRSGDVRVADFGFSRQLSEQMSYASLGGPTNPRWLAPEILCNSTGDGTHWTPQADVYSFGVILWELTTYQFPFGDLDQMQLMMQLMRPGGLSLPVPALADIPGAADFPALPRFLQLMERCLDKDPARRPQTFKDIIPELKSLQEDACRRRRTPAGGCGSSASSAGSSTATPKSRESCRPLQIKLEREALESTPSPFDARGPAPPQTLAPVMYQSTVSPFETCASPEALPQQRPAGTAQRNVAAESVISPFAQLDVGSGEPSDDEPSTRRGSVYQSAAGVTKPTVANAANAGPVDNGHLQTWSTTASATKQAPTSPHHFHSHPPGQENQGQEPRRSWSNGGPGAAGNGERGRGSGLRSATSIPEDSSLHLEPSATYKDSIYQFLEWFEQLDTDANGAIDPAELGMGIPDDISGGQEEDRMRVLFKLIEEFVECDTNGDGMIDQFEFLVVAGRMLRAQLERAGSHFDLQTYEAESKQVLAELKDRPKVYSMDAIDATVYRGIVQEYCHWFRDWDADKDDRLRLEDVQQYMQHERDHSCEQYQMAMELCVRFKDFDANGDGQIDKHEYLHLCARLLAEQHRAAGQEMDEARCRFHLYYYAMVLGDRASNQAEESVQYLKVQQVASHALGMRVPGQLLNRAASSLLGRAPLTNDRLSNTQFRRLLHDVRKQLEASEVDCRC